MYDLNFVWYIHTQILFLIVFLDFLKIIFVGLISFWKNALHMLIKNEEIKNYLGSSPNIPIQSEYNEHVSLCKPAKKSCNDSVSS